MYVIDVTQHVHNTFPVRNIPELGNQLSEGYVWDREIRLPRFPKPKSHIMPIFSLFFVLAELELGDA